MQQLKTTRKNNQAENHYMLKLDFHTKRKKMFSRERPHTQACGRFAEKNNSRQGVLLTLHVRYFE